MLEVKKINVFRGKLQTLWDVSIEVKKGEVVAMIGSNGAGKTTFLSTIAGLFRPSSGTILFQGREINGLPPHRIVGLGASYVPEDGKLFPHMKVRENLNLGAYCSRARAGKREALKLVYQLFPVLKERGNQLVMTLSGGERKMVAVARGLMSDPDLLILDEPSQGLAPKVTKEIFEAVEKLRNRGISILVAEQDICSALKFADRGYVMETGKVTLEGKGSELLENKYVKEAFLGL
jgi:branched-chain amino acid transport system ATP-binding protein